MEKVVPLSALLSRIGRVVYCHVSLLSLLWCVYEREILAQFYCGQEATVLEHGCTCKCRLRAGQPAAKIGN